MDKQKKTEPVDNYGKQLKVVGAIALVLAVVVVIVGIVLYAQSAPRRSAPSGGGEFVQLKGELDRIFSLQETIGIEETEGTLVIVMYEADPKNEWNDRERGQMDDVLYRALEEAAIRDKNLILTMTQPNSVVGVNGQDIDAIFVAVSFVCTNKEVMQETDWSKAGHEDILANCALYPIGTYWGNAEAILWPPAQ